MKSAYKVLVTRPAAQAQPLIALLEKSGYKVEAIPTLHIEYLEPPTHFSESDWMIFTSANAVLAIAPLLMNSHLPKVAAIGEATLKQLQDVGVNHVVIPKEVSSEGLLASPFFKEVAHQVITIVRGEGGRTALAEGLTQRGAEVRHLIVYKRHCPPPLQRDYRVDCDVIVSTSVESLNNLFQMLDTSHHPDIQNKQFIVFSDRGVAEARKLGVKCPARVAKASDVGIVEAINRWAQEQEE